MEIRLRKEQIPWGMAAGRALLGPVLVLGDRCGWSGLAMAAAVVTALLSDIFDGVLARRWRCDTAGVRLFDSMADIVFYTCAGIALWRMGPAVWRGEVPLACAVLGLEAALFVLSFGKFGKPASYHSWLAKACGLVLASALVTIFATGHATPLLHVALAMGIASTLEGIAMTLMLPVWCRDVRSLRAAWMLRKQLWEQASGNRDKGRHRGSWRKL